MVGGLKLVKRKVLSWKLDRVEIEGIERNFKNSKSRFLKGKVYVFSSWGVYKRKRLLGILDRVIYIKGSDVF